MASDMHKSVKHRNGPLQEDGDDLQKYAGPLRLNRPISDLFDLTGKIALVTGGAGVYGSVISTALAEAGATVIIASRDRERCEERANALRQQGYAAHGRHLDMTDDETIVALKNDLIEAFGALDIAFNNAAGRATGSAEEQKKNLFRHERMSMSEMTRSMWEQSMAVNASGFFVCCQVFAEAMRAQGVSGSIVNVSSIYGAVAPDFNLYAGTEMTSPPDYSYAKAGIIQLTRFMASYYGKDGIRVNCITPGGYYSGQPAEFVKRYEAKTLLGRMAAWNDIKGAAVFLASDASAYITGHNLVVDGGWCVT